MTARSSGLPSLWFVLVPALLLAALGARAVMTEAERAETEARQRARAAAGRLARSMETLLAEFEEALPDATTVRTPQEILESASFLSPVWLLGPDGRRIRSAGPPPAPSPRDAALLADALERANLAAAGEGGDVAAPLLVGTAAVVDSGQVRATLLLRAAELDAGAGRIEEAGRELADALSEAGDAPDPDWTGRWVAALRATLEREPRALNGVPWASTAAERAASGSWPLPPEGRATLLDLLEDHAAPADATRIRELRRTWDLHRRLASAETAPRASVELADGRVVITLRTRLRAATAGGPVEALLGGEVPAVTVEERLGDEARALVAEGGVAGVRLLAPDGAEVLRAGADTSGPGRLFVESASLGEPLSGFRTEAAAPRDGGAGTLAVLLAVAGALTTITLVWGAVALSRAARRQARLAEDRKRFLDHVAHEIRTPSTALLTLSEELASGHVPAEREPLYREHLLGEARRLADLVDDTLDLTRLEAGRLSFKRERLDLAIVLRRAAEASGARAKQSDGPGVELDVGEGPLVVLGDPTALRRTFRNLVDNAIAHGGGERPVEVRARSGGETITVTVRDHGRGIAAEHLPHLFERFYRVPEATHETKGIGLGLSLCHEVITRHGGTIAVESRPGEGTTFTASLPRGDRDGD